MNAAPDPATDATFAALSRIILDLSHRVASLERSAVKKKSQIVVPNRPRLANGNIVKALLSQASTRFDIAADLINSNARASYLVEARDWVIYEAHLLEVPYNQIGLALNRDHTSIIAAVGREAARRAAQ